MSACVLKSNPDYQKLLNNSNFTESTLNFIVNTYWKEHPEAAVEGREKYPSLEYVNSFYDTATSVAEIPATVRLWRLNARDTYDFSSLEEAMNKKQELAQTFDDEAILVWETKDDKYHVKVARPLLEDKDRGFSFNREQKNAIAKIADWFMDRNEGKVNDNWIVLEGEAGTGKTSIINDILLNTVNMYGGSVITGAVSNKATDNIFDKLSEQISRLFDVSRKTVAGMLNLKETYMDDGSVSFEDEGGEKALFGADIAIIDEASMVTEQVLEYIKEASEHNIPVLFIGDAAQIYPVRSGQYYDAHPEINKNADSPVFQKDSKKNNPTISLVERVRQGEDSPILEFTHKYREAWAGKAPLPNIRGEVSSADGRLIYTSKNVNDLLNDLLPVFKEAVRTGNHNLIHIVPFNVDYKTVRKTLLDKGSNILYSKAGYPRKYKVPVRVYEGSALWWNQKIYDLLHPETAGQYVFQEGDLLRFDDSYALGEDDIINNSTEAIAISSGDLQIDEHGVKYRILTLKLSSGRVLTIPVIEQTMENIALHSKTVGLLWSKIRGKEDIDRVKSYQKRYAKITLNYALNVHKAQGSTYDITVFDKDNMDGAPIRVQKEVASLSYTAATRAKNILLVASSQASDKDMKVDLLATNKLFNEARSKKPISVKKEDSTPISTALNSGTVMLSQDDEAQLQEASTLLQLRSPEAFAGVAESQQTIESERTILSNEELKYWNEKGVGEMPRILVGSEHSDPAFHTKQILDIINGKSTVLDRRTGKQITGNDFAGLYLITKHDGLPMLELLQTKIPKLIHFSITTLGGTEYEPGVMKYNDLLDKIEDYIKQGLDPESVTIRIDPIVPGVTKFTDIEEVVRRASTMGIKRIRFSVMDAYPDTVSGLSPLGYDFEKYYGSDPTGLSKSGYKFTAKRQYMENIFDFMLSLKDKYDITLGTCAEVFGREGINKEGCLSVSAVNNMLGISIPDLGTQNNQQRQLCSCYGGKVDALKYDDNCASHCMYCYAHHQKEKALEYYDADGKLKDNAFTRTRREQQIVNAQEIDVPGNMPQQKASYVLSDAELSQRDARKFNSAHFFTPLAEAGDSAVIDVLKEDVEKGNLQIGARLLISDGSTVDEIISATRILRKALSAHIYEGSAIPTDASKYSKEELEALNRAGIRNDGENVFIPSFSVGLSERQLSDIDKRERVNNYKLLTPSEIRAIGLKSMWKVSDIVSKLQTNGVNASRELLSSIDTLKDKDFTGYSRLQIINEVGIGRLLDIARDILFAPQGSDTPRESAKKQFIKENYSVIYEQAQDYLSLNEEITLTKNSVEKTATTQEVGGTLAELLNTDSEMEVAELLGSAAEHWMVGFRQVSAISSLSAMVRRNLSSLLDLDADGNAIADNYGPKLLDVHQAVVDMLHWVSGAKNSDDMLDRLERQMPANPWLRQLVGTYHEDGDPAKPERQGILIRPENGQLKTRFFTNFSKYFQPYIVMYKDNENNTMLREINTKQFSDSALNDLMLADEHKDLGYLSIWKPEGGLSDDFYELSRIIGQKATKGFPATGMQSPREEVNNEDLRNLQKALTLLNIQSPSIDELSVAIKDVKSYNDIAQRLWFIRRSIEDRAEAYRKNSKNEFTLFGKDNSIKSNLSAILKILEPVLHTNLEAVSYEAGKMHYGYVQPSYLNMHINDLKGNVDNYQEFLNTNFKNYDGWFYTSGNNPGLAGSGWLNEWLEMLEQRQQYRDMLQHVASLAFEGTGYTDKISPQMGASLLFAYFYDTNKTSAYYRVMLLSNKPSEEYIRFVRFTRGYDTHIIENLIKRTLPAEINRIRTVRERRQMVADGKLSKDNLVASLETGDVNGEKFYFLKFLNDHIANNTALGRAVEDMIDGTLSADPRDARYVEFIRLFDRGFREFMESRFNEFLDNLEADGTITREGGNIVAVYGVQDKVGTRTAARNNLMEFFWNDWYAQLNMQQILFGDPAQYVNAEDLQKRAAQFHSPGMRPDIAALDIKSNRPVSDGFERFVVLDDIVKPSSASVVLEQVHAKILSDPRFTNPDGTLTALGKEKSAMLERIRNLFKDDNVTDGQAVISPTGLRKIMHLFGKWDAHMDEVYDKITSGEDFTNADLDVIWPVIKPFSYSVIAKNTYSSRMPFFSLGVQQKNSMFPIVLAGALARSVGVDNWLTALYDVMENSSREGGNAKNDGIDAVLFASNLKTGLYGSTDISKMSPEQVRNTLNARIQPVNGQTDINGNQRKYNNDYVYEIPFGDWSQQQEVPNHFEGSQQKGSQQRVLTVADTPNTSIDAEGNIKDNFVIVRLLDGTLQKMTVREAKSLYFKAHADNINRSAERLAKELALDTKNRKLRNIALSNALVEELKKDGRYGVDMIRAVSVDRFGEFVTPLSDPMLAGVIQQMLNSLIKNRIYKQQIAGGPLVQVSSFGLSKDLNIVYGKDTGRPLYAEVMISAPNEWYEKDANGEYIYKEFFDKNGELSVERINAVNPKILEMIGYRIPTEAKYSMLPMKIVGFLPRSTESIMLPKEITVLSGSDFDVDKLYIMRRVFQRIVDRKTGNVTYTTDVRDTDERNNNIILDIDWAFLTSELNTDQTISAGQFDDLKRVGYSIAAADNQDPSIKDITKFVDSLAGKGPKQLKKDAYSPSDLMFADTQIKFFKQNMVAAKLIGVFAQANVSHAFVSLLYDKTFVPTVRIDDSIRLKLLDRNGSEHNLVGDVAIDNEWDWSGLKRISAILAECIGASVDAVKDPVFNLMNINMATVNAFSTMIRFGWDTDSMAWFLTTPIIKELVKRYDRLNADGSASIEQVISQLQTEIADQRPMIFDENHAWSKDDFIKMHRQDVVSTKREEESDDEFIRRKYETAHRNWQLLEVFRRMQAMADMTRSIVHITRSNSISAAPGPFAANTFVDDLKTAKFINMKALDGVKGILNNPVIASFMNTTSSLVRNILGDNLVQAGELAYKIYDGVEKMFGYINDDLAQKMSEFMASYLTQWVNPVFDISYNNRKLMLLGFPNIFEKAKLAYPDNKLLKGISLKYTEDNHTPYLELNTRGLEEGDISDLKAAWSTLYKAEEKRLAGGDPFDYQNGNLALKLVEYNYFRGGFGFDSKTFTRIVPEDVKDHLGNYRANTRALTGIDSDSIDIDNLIYQFMLNYGKTNMPLQEDLNIQKREDGTLYIPEQDGNARGFANKGIVGVKQGKAGIKYYLVNFDADAGEFLMYPVSKLGGKSRGFEIEPRTDVRNMKSVFETAIQNQEGSQQTPEDSKSGLINIINNGSETSTTTKILLDKMLGRNWMSQYSTDGKTDVVSAFKAMTDAFFDTWQSQAVDKITDKDNFVLEVLNKVKFNLPASEVEGLVQRAIERLNEENICH